METEVEERCGQCGNNFKQIGNHWSKSKDCSHPELSEYKKDILIGLLMGDGSIGGKNYKNQYICVEMISPNYLEYVDNKLGWLSTGVSFHATAEESAERCRSSGFRPNADKKNYSDKYRMWTRHHPFITSLTEWYSSGSKVWPDDIELTPTVLKHWYVGDGCYVDKNTSNHIQISMANEFENREKVSSYFTEVGLPEPQRFDIDKRDKYTTCNAVWSVEDSRSLWKYMGEPLPDFSYKWPKDMR